MDGFVSRNLETVIPSAIFGDRSRETYAIFFLVNGNPIYVSTIPDFNIIKFTVPVIRSVVLVPPVGLKFERKF